MKLLKINLTGVVLSTLFLFLCVAVTNAQQTKTITYKGNTFELQTFPIDTSIVENPLTGEEAIVVTTRSDRVLSMNGNPVYTAATDDEQVNIIKEELANDISKTLKKNEKKLGSGNYKFGAGSIVVDKAGKIVYLEPAYIRRIPVIGLDGEPINKAALTDEDETRIQNKMNDILENTTVTPIAKDGEPVISIIEIKGDFVIP